MKQPGQAAFFATASSFSKDFCGDYQIIFQRPYRIAPPPQRTAIALSGCKDRGSLEVLEKKAKEAGGQGVLALFATRPSKGTERMSCKSDF